MYVREDLVRNGMTDSAGEGPYSHIGHICCWPCWKRSRMGSYVDIAGTSFHW
eukprot:COSAG01_NODE_46588_length_398_cov_97.575251_1_plen_51_part_01